MFRFNVELLSLVFGLNRLATHGSSKGGGGGVCWRHTSERFTHHCIGTPTFLNSAPTRQTFAGPECEQVRRVDDYTCIILTLQHNRLYVRINQRSRLDFDLTGVWANVRLRKYTQSLSGWNHDRGRKKTRAGECVHLISTDFYWFHLEEQGETCEEILESSCKTQPGKRPRSLAGGRDGSKTTPTIPLGPRQAAQWVPVA